MTGLVLVGCLGILALPLAGALMVFSTEVFMGLMPLRRSAPPPCPVGTRAVVLMPAHDEAKVIADTVTRMLPHLGVGLDLLVIADNCSDDTAQIARDCGARVTERSDLARRGKGYALAHGVSVLASEPPDCVIVVDADAWPVSNSLQRLVDRVIELGRPVQGCFLIEPDKSRGPITRVSNFAHMLKNRVRQRGVARLSGSAFLCGSAMAFPWRVIAKSDLANGETVEDLVLGIRQLLAGDPPMFDDEASVFSRSAPGDAETRDQRSRWEGGFVATAGRFAPALLRHAATTRSLQPLWMALHLVVPPFVILMGLAALYCLAAGIGMLLLGIQVWFAGLFVMLCITALALVGLAWWCEGRDYLDLADLAALPRYFGSKIGIWAGLIRSRSVEWNRTGR